MMVQLAPRIVSLTKERIRERQGKRRFERIRATKKYVVARRSFVAVNTPPMKILARARKGSKWKGRVKTNEKGVDADG